MFFPKIFGASAVTGAAAAVITAEIQPGSSPQALALVGAVTAILSALVGSYAAYREIKGRHDAKDLRLKCVHLEADRDRWKALCVAVPERAGRRASPRTRRAKAKRNES
jgi:hypothetical protein